MVFSSDAFDLAGKGQEIPLTATLCPDSAIVYIFDDKLPNPGYTCTPRQFTIAQLIFLAELTASKIVIGRLVYPIRLLGERFAGIRGLK